MKEEDKIPLISVIVPVYNVEKYIEKCIKSIIAQTYQKLELFLIDDGSTDCSGAICEKVAETDSRIHVIHQGNRGVAVARKCGIALSDGDYIGFVDGDDWIEENMLEELVKNMRGADLISSGIFLQPSQMRETIKYDCFKSGYYKGDGLKKIYECMLYDFEHDVMRPFTPSLWNKLFVAAKVKKIYKEIDCEVRFAEDAMFIYRYLLQCHSLVILDKCFYHYRYREDSAVHSVDERRLIDINKVYLNLLSVFKQHQMAECLVYQLQKWVTVLTQSALDRHMGFDKRIHIMEFAIDCDGLRDKKIILYGAGKCGQDIYKQLFYFGYEIAIWVDQDFLHYNKMDLDVVTPESIHHVEYDVVVIAVSDEKIADEIRNELMKRKINASKIVWRKPLKLF